MSGIRDLFGGQTNGTLAWATVWTKEKGQESTW